MLSIIDSGLLSVTFYDTTTPVSNELQPSIAFAAAEFTSPIIHTPGEVTFDPQVSINIPIGSYCISYPSECANPNEFYVKAHGDLTTLDKFQLQLGNTEELDRTIVLYAPDTLKLKKHLKAKGKLGKLASGFIDLTLDRKVEAVITGSAQSDVDISTEVSLTVTNFEFGVDVNGPIAVQPSVLFDITPKATIAGSLNYAISVNAEISVNAGLDAKAIEVPIELSATMENRLIGVIQAGALGDLDVATPNTAQFTQYNLSHGYDCLGSMAADPELFNYPLENPWNFADNNFCHKDESLIFSLPSILLEYDVNSSEAVATITDGLNNPFNPESALFYDPQNNATSAASVERSGLTSTARKGISAECGDIKLLHFLGYGLLGEIGMQAKAISVTGAALPKYRASSETFSTGDSNGTINSYSTHSISSDKVRETREQACDAWCNGWCGSKVGVCLYREPNEEFSPSPENEAGTHDDFFYTTIGTTMTSCE